MYLIEPLASEEAEMLDNRGNPKAHRDEGPHAVYNYKHLRRKRSSCSHGNTTTFYDHGARPSGLFQLGSLVKRQHGHIHRISKLKTADHFCSKTKKNIGKFTL